jgi:hypothetical protein
VPLCGLRGSVVKLLGGVAMLKPLPLTLAPV